MKLQRACAVGLALLAAWAGTASAQPGGYPNQTIKLLVGFAPGAPYVGILPEQLNVPRRATPRTVLPKGSVAIANQQTIIYPNESPGGWHLIGRSPVNLFDARRSPAALLAPGDQVRFVPLIEGLGTE